MGEDLFKSTYSVGYFELFEKIYDDTPIFCSELSIEKIPFSYRKHTHHDPCAEHKTPCDNKLVAPPYDSKQDEGVNVDEDSTAIVAHLPTPSFWGNQQSACNDNTQNNSTGITITPGPPDFSP